MSSMNKPLSKRSPAEITTITQATVILSLGGIPLRSPNAAPLHRR